MTPLQNLNWQQAFGSLKALEQSFQQRLIRYDEALASASPSSHIIYTLLESISQRQQTKLFTILIGSDFAAQYCCQHPDFFAALLEAKNGQVLDLNQLSSKLKSATLHTLAEELAELRHQAMVQIIWQDFNRLSTTEQTIENLSLLAESLIQIAAQRHYDELSEQHGKPLSAEGHTQSLLIIGMGKLGAWELNLSSDVDLIFAFSERGETNGITSISNESFFTQLGQRLIKTLEAKQAFRVDMRLRPYGQSGALVSSFAALEAYYQAQGRPWERFAMVKARVVATAGNDSHSEVEELQALIHNFTYRSYLDYSAIESLRQLKIQINREVQRKRLQNDIKLGRGGIREIEFIAQAFQVIRGGRDRALRERRVLRILSLLEAQQCLPRGVAETLCSAYRFLRNVEHALQGFQDKQTHELPEQVSDLERVAFVMGFPSHDTFSEALNKHYEQVSIHFQAVIADKDGRKEKHVQNADFISLWHQALQSQTFSSEELQALGFTDDGAGKSLCELASSAPVQNMDTISHERLDKLMPQLLENISRSESPATTLARLMPLLSAIARRSAYLVLLIEHPKAVDQLVQLSEASPWIASCLVDYPALLDELLDTTTLYSVPARHLLVDELRQSTLRLPPDDLEAQMDALRYFKNAHSLRVAACEITQKLPLMKISDYLSELAEVILVQVLHLAWQEMVRLHGVPAHIETDLQPDLMIVAYGKLGGIELSHQSDLDLVFIHNADPNGQSRSHNNSAKALDHATYYARLGQKIIHIASTRMASGRLYEIDMRLRPSGASGPLVSSMKAFEKYQKDNAWTWEHQALVRTRVITAPPDLQARFEQVRHTILTRQREEAELRNAITEMREKMRGHLGSKKRGSKETGSKKAGFDIKQDTGGIVDIEFMVQYMVLNWAHSYPALTRYSDNIRVLSCIEESGKLLSQEVGRLTAAYKAFRSCGHTLALQQLPTVLEGNSLQNERAAVVELWEKLMING